MARHELPRVMDQRQAIALLEMNGWTRDRGGKHVVKMVKPGSRPVTLPDCRRGTYTVGFTARILRQAGLRGPEGGEHGE